MRFTLKPSASGSKTKSPRDANFFDHHPDLPLSPNPQSRRSPRPEESKDVARSRSVSERFSSGYSGDRRSIAIEPGFDASVPFSPDDFPQPAAQQAGGLSRSQTVLRREGARKSENIETQPSPAPLWSPDFSQLPTPSEQSEGIREFIIEAPAPMFGNSSGGGGKTSSDSGQGNGLDRWSQRRLQRLNTEQGFREQRQGVLSPTAGASESGYTNTNTNNNTSSAGPSSYGGHAQGEQQPQLQQAQPHVTAYQSARSGPGSHANAGLASQAQGVPSVSSSSRSPYQSAETTSVQHSQQYQPHHHHQPYSPESSGLNIVTSDSPRPAFPQRTHSSQQQQPASSSEESSMSASTNGGISAPKAVRSTGGGGSNSNNRQSMHNGLSSREAPASAGQNGGQTAGGVPAFNAAVVPPAGQTQAYSGAQQQQSSQSQQQQTRSGGDLGRITPQPVQSSEDMTEEDVNQLIKDHKELREKYTKVKKYYFEKEDQVKQLQNSLAHQRLSQSRTSLDDSEYSTRFSRLDGLVAQLAFSIRKSWRTMPQWLSNSVNKDAVQTGKQEMTAAGRAFISWWLVEEVFDKYFHPDLEPTLSAQLKMIQKNIRRYAPPAQTAEEEEYLTAKVVNWRLSTLEGLQESLRSPQCPNNRAHLTDQLKNNLVQALAIHLVDPPPSDLEGGVHMIVELVVSIAIHLPLESRDVQIEYFLPGQSVLPDHMKLESGIPPLVTSIAEDAAERGSIKSSVSEAADNDNSNTHDQPAKKRSMLSALTGSKPKDGRPGDPQRHIGDGGSSGSLNRPSSQGKDQHQRVRMAAGIGVQIRQRSVLVKAPVFATP